MSKTIAIFGSAADVREKCVSMLTTEEPTRSRFGVTAETTMVQADTVSDPDAIREQADYVFLLDELAAIAFGAGSDDDFMLAFVPPGGIVIWCRVPDADSASHWRIGQVSFRDAAGNPMDVNKLTRKNILILGKIKAHRDAWAARFTGDTNIIFRDVETLTEVLNARPQVSWIVQCEDFGEVTGKYKVDAFNEVYLLDAEAVASAAGILPTAPEMPADFNWGQKAQVWVRAYSSDADYRGWATAETRARRPD